MRIGQLFRNLCRARKREKTTGPAVFVGRFRTRDSVSVMSKVWQGGPEETSQRLLLLALADAANDEGFCWPGTSNLARKICTSVRTVLRLFKSLEKDGSITIKRKAHLSKGNTYQINLAKLDDIAMSRDTVSRDDLSRDKSGISQVTSRAKSGDISGNGNIPVSDRNDSTLQPKSDRITIKNHHRTTKGDAFVLPEWVPTAQWNAWLDMRKKARKSPTDYAMTLAVRKLDDFRKCGNDPGAVLDQSTGAGWPDLYPLKGQNVKPQQPPVPREYAKDEEI
jgi:hypothetical protein